MHETELVVAPQTAGKNNYLGQSKQCIRFVPIAKQLLENAIFLMFTLV